MANPLLIATLEGGDPSNDYSDSAIWMDLDGPRPANQWLALVSDRQAAEVLAENTGGAEVVSVAQWDGAPFGDGNLGTVESPRPGVLRSAHFAGCRPTSLPEDWQIENR